MRTLISTAIVALITTHSLHAGSFSLYTEGTASAESNYAAGIAAEAADASTGWYNPAGLALIHSQQMVVGGAGVFPVSKISGTSTFSTPPLPNYVQSFSDFNGAKSAFVPSFHYALPLGENTTFGLSVVSPFGLSTNWDWKSPVRYAATYSELITTTVSPEIGAKLNEHFALGAGIDFQYARVKFNQVLGSPAYMTALSPLLPGDPGPRTLDSTSYNKGQSTAVGFHAGAMFMFNDNHSRVGVNYLSTVNHKFHGHSQLHGKLASPGINIFNPVSLVAANPHAKFRTNTLTSNNIEFPDILTISGYQDVNDRLALLGSVVFTGWSVLESINLNNVAAFVPGVGQANVNSVSTTAYRDTWRVAAGANYKVNSDWMLRVGGGYDQTPTNNANRDIRIADTNRWALSAGTRYQARPDIGVELGYTHLFSVSDEPINKTQLAGSGSTYNIHASATGSADLVGLQVVWLIDGVKPVAPMK